MSLQVDFMGWKLDNPLLVAAGNWSKDGESIKRALDAGAAAVISKTIVNQTSLKINPHLSYRQGQMVNICFYNNLALEQWAEEMQVAKSAGGKVIASVLAYSPSEMSYIAKKMEKYGADGLEINLSTLMWDGAEIFVSDVGKLQDILKNVLQAVDIPVMLKISPHVSNLPRLIHAAESSGITAISGIESLRSILGVNISTRHPVLPTFSGYSGAAIRPLGLASVATIAQNVSVVDVCGVGGIETYENVLEYIMLGANAVQVGTAILLQGYGVLGTLKQELERYMSQQGLTNLSQLRGTALKNLYSFDELQSMPYVATLKKACPAVSCQKCLHACLEKALQKTEEGLRVNTHLCDGCGLCVDLCQEGCLELRLP